MARDTRRRPKHYSRPGYRPGPEGQGSYVDQKGAADALDQAGHLECHCIPGHRSNHVTHRCEDCGLADKDIADGQPIPPCQPSSG